ncbi:MAG: hypothetical protein D6765_08695, partial [Bacteroidetes bacterium]
LLFLDGNLWTHEDGGNSPALYQIDPADGSILKTVTLGAASNVDWEDIASDGTFIYVGDFGNNATGARTDLRIYKFDKNDIPAGTNVTIPAADIDTIDFTYSDQSNCSPPCPNGTDFDCEAMIYHNGLLHLFTKQWVSEQTSHYTLSPTPGTHVAAKQSTFNAQGLITGADIVNGNEVMLIGYDLSPAALFAWRLTGFSGTDFFGGTQELISFNAPAGSTQIEGVHYFSGTDLYLSAEQAGPLDPTLYSFSTTLLPVELSAFHAAALPHGIELNWETQSEKNNRGFEVQRAPDARSWKTLTFIHGQGTTLEPQSYRFLDERPLTGLNYYRLVQLDEDGTLHPSFVLAVEWRPLEAPPLLLFPNPCSGELFLQWNSPPPGPLTLHVYTLEGQLLWTERFPEAPERWTLPAALRGDGVWVLRLESAHLVLWKKILVQRPR